MTLVKFNSDKNNNQRGLVPSFNNVFDSIFTDSFFSGRDAVLVPSVNICETADSFQVELAAPGLEKSDFKLSVDRKLLNVSVEKEQTNEMQDKSYSRKEFSYQSFVRSFTLPEGADENGIGAKYENGILNITIPKKEEAKMISRQIEIS
ncbi:MAG: Hsp20/alpha crystallin family protein [Pedobacter sp.]|nr:MAG: Hsp20/alpha crystallin family protein [Pedobacter sp.]